MGKWKEKNTEGQQLSIYDPRYLESETTKKLTHTFEEKDFTKLEKKKQVKKIESWLL